MGYFSLIKGLWIDFDMDNKSLESTLASITSSKSLVNSGTTSDGPTKDPTCRREITYFSLIKGLWIDFDMDNKSLESTLASITSSKSLVNSGTTSDGPTKDPTC